MSTNDNNNNSHTNTHTLKHTSVRGGDSKNGNWPYLGRPRCGPNKAHPDDNNNNNTNININNNT